MKKDRVESHRRQEMSPKNPYRVSELIRAAIADLNLDLSGLVVLTEAAGGNYFVTPLIAAMANAKKVTAVTRDSKYAKAKEVKENTLSLAKFFGIREDIIEIFDGLKPDLIEKADIVTNLGFLRPIDRDFISHLKESAVIPLMYETWEFREQDLDLRECWKKKIPILGTNEQHEALRIFDYIGHLCMKILLEAEIEVYRSRIVLVGSNRFGRNIVRTLSDAGANVLCVTDIDEKSITQSGGKKIGITLKDQSVQKEIRNCDAIIINTFPDYRVAVGEDGDISAHRLRELACGAIIVQFNGLIERKSLRKYGFACLPEEEPKIGHMGWTLAYLGPRPVIALNSGGLKVGELLAKAKLQEFDRIKAERSALENDICQDFSSEQREKYEN